MSLSPSVSVDDLSWVVEHASGSAGDLHARASDFSSRLVRVNHVSRPAVVLSSTQSEEILDMPAIHAAGLEVVRRSSGGGLVHLRPGAQLWVDVFLPRGDPLWSDDVTTSALWLGSAWSRAFSSLGVDSTDVESGRWSNPRLGRVVCFAAIGSGEVTRGGKKLVGISQRRTRLGARFQSTVYAADGFANLIPLLVADVVSRGVINDLSRALSEYVETVPTSIPLSDVLAALVEQLP